MMFLGITSIYFLLLFIINFFFVELMFLETSALTGENVEEAFLKCSRTILNKIESGNVLYIRSCTQGKGFDCFMYL